MLICFFDKTAKAIGLLLEKILTRCQMGWLVCRILQISSVCFFEGEGL